MRKVIDNTWKPVQKEFFDNQPVIEGKALQLLKNGHRDEALKLLTDYTSQCGLNAINTAWDTGDYIWTVFDGAW